MGRQQRMSGVKDVKTKHDDLEYKLLMGDLDAFSEAGLVEDELEQEEQTPEEPVVEDVSEALSAAKSHQMEMLESLRLQDYAKTDLSDKQLEVASKLAKSLKEDDLTQLTNFGVLAQEQMGTFSDELLKRVRVGTKGVESTLDLMLNELKGTKSGELVVTKPNFVGRIFRNEEKQIAKVTKRHEKLNKRLEEVTNHLVAERDWLLDDISTLEELYVKNKQYYASVNVFIAAGVLKLEELVKETIPLAIEEAQRTGSAGKVQEVNDLVTYMNRLERRVHDLKLTRQVITQQAPQIKIVQETNQQLAEKINASLNTAIPLWKNQMVLALALSRQGSASQIQKKVTDTTNKLLRQNADLLHGNTINITRENERALVDIETLTYTQEKLIKTLDDTIQIQLEGKRSRREAEKVLLTMDDQLKDSILRRAMNTYTESEIIDVTPHDDI